MRVVAVDIPGGPAGELGRPADALAAFQQVIDRYGEDPAPDLREQVAAAMLRKMTCDGDPLGSDAR